MEATKKVTGKSVKKWLGNNAIIVLMLAVSLIVGIIHPNFFALANIINLFKNVYSLHHRSGHLRLSDHHR